MENQQLRKWILQLFKLNGYSISADAASFLAERFEPLSVNERHKWMEKITDNLLKLNVKSLVVDKEHVELCFQECTRKSEDEDKMWNVINIFEVPRFVFLAEKNKFVLDECPVNAGLFSDAICKIMMYRRRYDTILQRTLRHDIFKHQKGIGGDNPTYVLRTVEWFLCCTERIEHAVVVGLLVQKNETTYGIEDLTGSLQLDISKAKFHDGLFPEHCFVLIEGVYEDKVLYVHGIGFPPAEPSFKSRPFFGNVNTFGGPSEVDLTQCQMLEKIQKRNADAMIVFISEVWLDRPEVMDKLRLLFSGFEEHPPIAFVLIGNFLSSHKGSQNTENLRSKLKALGEIILKERGIINKSRIVLVPGPADPGSPLILPRAPLPKVITADLMDLVPNVILATNPCRIQYCNRQIVVFREDLIKKMCRNTIHFPKDGKIESHFTKTITSQANLVPMSPNVCPVYWNFSHCLDIYPLPDLLVMADQFKDFTENHMGCTVINPGVFMKNGFSFRVYIPQSNEIEESVIPDGGDLQA